MLPLYLPGIALQLITPIVAIGRLLSFPLDIELAKIPSITSDLAADVPQYLRLVSNDHRFATETLKILLDETSKSS